eukprot:TRINITY_DN43182_c0_g1_i1.p1 TRINITY_DN43182_c0_g1~~TRINITY_DN43182_c0_g1_i1.p1  ORF type:complete len:665 (-),score=105.55 TRINITY_DN43182_c0_g1_i1:23-2017(-)
MVHCCLRSFGAHVGLRRACLRLLLGLFIGDVASVSPALLRMGLWTAAVEAVEPPMRHQEIDVDKLGHDELLDWISLVAELISLVTTAAAHDSQLFLWLANSSRLLHSWQVSLEGLAYAGSSAELSLACPNTKVPQRATAGNHLGFQESRISKLFRGYCSCLCSLINLLKTHISDAESANPSLPGVWDSVIDFLASPSVGAFLAESLAEWLPIAPQRIAMMALSSLSALRLLLLKLQSSKCLASDDDLLGRRACAYFVRHESLATNASNATNHDIVDCTCLVNLFRCSGAAALAAWNANFGQALSRLAAKLSVSADRPSLQSQPEQQKLVWVLRMFFALLSSSEDVRDDAMSWKDCTVSTQSVASDRDKENASQPPQLAMLLLGVRAAAERNEALCIEFLSELERLLSQEAAIGRFAELLLKTELVPWLMRLSLKKNLASPVFCRLMNVLCFCGPALAATARQVLLRYLGQVLEMIRVLSKNQKGTNLQLSDTWRHRRLVAGLNFVASLPHCTRAAELLCGGRQLEGAAGRRSMAAPAVAGLDLWLDLVESSQVAGAIALPVSVRCAALKVLLSLVASSTPHAKNWLLSCGRALPVFAKIVQTGAAALVELVLNILWVIVHNNQRALPAFRQHAVLEAIDSRAELAREGTGYTAVMLRQLEAILR